MLARELSRIVPCVSAIDLDRPSIELACQQGGAEIEYLIGDFLTHDFAASSFNVVVSVAAVHHMDAAAALRRMRDLVAPGGRLIVVGLARSRYPADLPRELAAAIAHRVHRVTKPYWQHSAPTVRPPPQTYPQVQRLARELLPAVRYRRHLLWRYSLSWTNPAAGT